MRGFSLERTPRHRPPATLRLPACVAASLLAGSEGARQRRGGELLQSLFDGRQDVRCAGPTRIGK